MSMQGSNIRELTHVKKIPLRVVLIVPFISLIFIAMGLTGYLSFRNGQAAVNNVAGQLCQEITARISEHIRTFMAVPHQVNKINENAIRLGLLDINDPKILERYFWEQIQTFDSLTSVYFGNTEGGLADAGREGAQGSLYVIATDGFKRGPFRKYATDSQGNRTELLTSIPDFDARTRSWYIKAVEKADAVWSEVYILFTGQDMNISASLPVYDKRQNLLGVLSDAIFLSHISHFLENLSIGETGRAFIIERSGLLIASSANEKPFTQLKGTESQRRLHASESAIPAIRHAAEALDKRLNGYHKIAGAQHIKFEIDGQLQFLQALPLSDECGLDWLIVAVIPQADFMNQIKANNRVTAFFIILTLVIALIIGVFTTRMITRPISRLQASSQVLARGGWTKAIRDDSRLHEINALTQSFNQMAGQLRQMLDDLNHEIVQRDNAEQELQAREEKYRILVENQTDFIVKFDINGRLLFVSPSYCKTFDKSREELIRTSFMPLIHKDDREHVAKAIENVCKPPHTAYIEERVMTKDGWRWQSWMNTGVLDDDQGQVNYIIAVGRDITGRKRAEEALKENEARYRELFDNISSGVAVYEVKENGKDFIFKDFNTTAERMDGDKKENLIGKSIFDMRPGIKEFGLIDVFQKVWKTGKPATHPITLYQDEKLTGWYENFVYKLPSGEIVAVFDDITDRKQAEEEIKKFRTISDMAVHGNAIADLHGNIIYINDYFAQIHGYAPEELIGRNLSIFHNKKQIKTVCQTNESLVEKGNFGPMEVWHTHKNGTEFPMLMSGIVIKDKSGNPQHMAATAIDITAIKQIQEALSAKNKELESYLYAASHDLRSPLVNIQGFSRRLQKQTDAIKKALSEVTLETDIQQTIEKITDRGVPKSLDFILTSVSKMDTLINGLLKISRTGRVKMAVQKIDMNNMMEKIIRSFRFQIEEAAVDVVVENLPDCYGDANLLNQLFSNIIGNALKYRDEKRQLIITVTAQKQHNKIIYSLKDTGVGIAPNHLKKIWDVFYRADSLSPEAGEGIGLNIVQRIAEKHNGKIRVESEEGRGSVFYIELPGNEFSE